MNIFDIKIGTRFEFELVNGLGERIGQTYVSQLVDIVDEHNIMIGAPIRESHLVSIYPKSRIRVIFIYKRHSMISFLATVTLMENKGNIPVLYIKIESDFEPIQRRNHYRLDCILNIEYKMHIPDEAVEENEKSNPVPPTKKGITKNISGSGVCIFIGEDIVKDSILDVDIHFSEGYTIHALCKVIRSKSVEIGRMRKYELGLHFIRISNNDQKFLVRYIFEQQRILLKKNLLV